MARCSWPCTGGGGGDQIVNFSAYDFAPPAARDITTDNPPLLVTYPDLSFGWFSTGVRFPPILVGGTYVETTYLLPPDVDPLTMPWISLAWTVPWTPGGAGGVCGWEAWCSVLPDGGPLPLCGPATLMPDTAAALDTIYITDEVQIFPTGGTIWGPDQLLNIRIGRAGNGPPYDNIADNVVMYALRLRYKRS